MCCKYELSRSDSFARSSSYEKLANLDDVSGPVGFNIQLDECDSTTSGSVKILFLAHLLLEKITPWLYKARHLELQQMLGFRYLTPQGIL